MAEALLVIGAKQKNRQRVAGEILEKYKLAITEIDPDVLSVEPQEDKKSIGIDQIREATKFLFKKPLSHKNKAVVIVNAHLLTHQAQNAFLKTLEELPVYAFVILGSKTEAALLSTVVSRCKLIKDRSAEGLALERPTPSPFTSMSIGERLSLAAQIAKKEKGELIETLEDWILYERQTLLAHPKAKAQNIALLAKVMADLETTNVTAKLALEYLLISLKQ